MQSHVSVRAGASQRSQEERGHGHRGGVPGASGLEEALAGMSCGGGGLMSGCSPADTSFWGVRPPELQEDPFLPF